MCRWIDRCCKERPKDVLQVVDKAAHGPHPAVCVVQPRDLHHPSDIRTEKTIVNNPSGQLCPLLLAPPVDAQAILGHLVLARLKLDNYLLGKLGKIGPTDQIVGL